MTTNSILQDYAGPDPKGAKPAEPQPPLANRPMTIHPAVVVTAIAGWAWAVAALFIVALLSGDGTAIGAVIIVAGISIAMFGLMSGCGWWSRRVAMRGNTRLAKPRSFGEFLAGEVQVGNDRMKGSEIYLLVVAMAFTLAILGTGFAVGIGVA